MFQGISVYREPSRCGKKVHILRYLFCAMQNLIRHEIVGKQPESESYFDLPRGAKIVVRYTIQFSSQVCSFGCRARAPTLFSSLRE